MRCASTSKQGLPGCQWGSPCSAAATGTLLPPPSPSWHGSAAVCSVALQHSGKRPCQAWPQRRCPAARKMAVSPDHSRSYQVLQAPLLHTLDAGMLTAGNMAGVSGKLAACLRTSWFRSPHAMTSAGCPPLSGSVWLLLEELVLARTSCREVASTSALVLSTAAGTSMFVSKRTWR